MAVGTRYINMCCLFSKELATKEMREQRYKRLQFLLNKSNMYTKYLVKRMEDQVNWELEKLLGIFKII